MQEINSDYGFDFHGTVFTKRLIKVPRGIKNDFDVYYRLDIGAIGNPGTPVKLRDAWYGCFNVTCSNIFDRVDNDEFSLDDLRWNRHIEQDWMRREDFHTYEIPIGEKEEAYYLFAQDGRIGLKLYIMETPVGIYKLNSVSTESYSVSTQPLVFVDENLKRIKGKRYPVIEGRMIED